MWLLVLYVQAYPVLCWQAAAAAESPAEDSAAQYAEALFVPAPTVTEFDAVGEYA